MAEAMTDHAHSATFATADHTIMTDTDTTAEDCCAVSHMEHEIDAIAFNVSKVSVNIHAIVGTLFPTPINVLSFRPQFFSRSDQYPNRALLLTGTVIKRE